MARTTDLLGDWWTPIVLRELLLGVGRFNDIRSHTGISRAVLSQRLQRLESDGVVERHRYEERPPRDEYRLTEKGRALWDVIAAMWQFGDDWMYTERPGAQVELVDRRTGEPVRVCVVDEQTGEPIEPDQTRVRLRR